MSRIRTVKPEFWTSEQVISCSPIARLLFIGLWSFCDDNGVHPASYIRLKAEVFPADSFNTHEIKQWISELINNKLIREYMIDAKAYWIVTGWKQHQRIDKPTYRHPLPQLILQKIEDHSTITPIILEDLSVNNHRIIDDASATECNGKEGKGEDVNICEVKTSPVNVCESNLVASTQLFEYWQCAMNHPRAKLDKKRKRTLEQALKLGYSVSELQKAIDGCKNTPFHMGKNDNNQVYDDISLIFRDAEHIDRFIRNADNISEGDLDSRSNLMAGVL